MKVLLLNPPTGRYMRSDRCQAPVDTRVAEPPRPPMDLAYISAVLESVGVACKIRDYPMEDKSWKEVSDDLQGFMPDIVVIDTTTPTIENDLITCDIAKKINFRIRTVAKGAHFLALDKEVLAKFKNLDIAVRGEPEITLQELAGGRDYSEILGITFRRDLEIIRNPDRPFLENLDKLPFPARHLFNNQLYRTPDTNEPIAFITTSRGCPRQCVFCAAGIVSGYKIRMRSVGSIIEEIEECIEKYGIKNFFFSADTFTWDKQWVINLCEEIITRDIKIRWGANSRVDTLDEDKATWMKRAGCYVIGFGAESASQFMLDKIGKDITVGQIENAIRLCKEYGIESFLVFVIGLPWETRETANETLRFVKKTQASFIEVNVAYPLPGTEFYNIARENGLFDEETLCGHNYSNPLVRSYSLSTDELRDLRKKILKAFYMKPSYIAKRISRINSLRLALSYFKYGTRLISNLSKN
jgi:anaerobic magnesium-protoporphyrin IX monomethyl ester cyclase